MDAGGRAKHGALAEGTQRNTGKTVQVLKKITLCAPVSSVVNFLIFFMAKLYKGGQSRLYRCDLCLEPEVQVGTSWEL